jgi:hypothetical protein
MVGLLGEGLFIPILKDTLIADFVCLGIMVGATCGLPMFAFLVIYLYDFFYKGKND